MGFNKINLLFRFLLEIAALISMGTWGWNQSTGIFRFFLALGIPLIAALMWGTFAVPDDQSRSGKAPVQISGSVRLFLELVILAWATWSLYDLGLSDFGLIFGLAVVIHYIISYDRILWLIRN